MIHTPVLIVGGGPVGLTLALALSRQGVRSMVVNDRKETTTHPKLDVVNCRSMEVFRQLGLAHKIRAAGNPVGANQYSAAAASASGPFYTVMTDRHLVYQPAARGAELIRECSDGSLPREPMQRIAQMNLEPVLLDEARADPNIELRFGSHLYGFEQDDGGVTALIHDVDSGDASQIRSLYLIGCDGPNSRVRNFLNIDYDATRDLLGELFIIHFRSTEIHRLYPNDEPYWHTWIMRPGFSGLLVSPDASRTDYVLHRPFAPRKGETLESIVDAAIGQKLSYEIVQSGPWRPQFLVARSFGRKRVFIAGDATHQYMPTGGLGMNTGVTEAHNLAWKLAAMVNGWGGPLLMQSYEAERLPIARRNRDHVKKCAAAVVESQFDAPDIQLGASALAQASRAAIATQFESKVSRLYEALGVEIGYRYRNASTIVPDSSSEPPSDDVRYEPTTWPGSRLPNAFDREGTALLDRVPYRSFVLFGSDAHVGEIEPLSQAAALANVPLTWLSVDEPHLRTLLETRFVLVRPDQHVCWRGDAIPADCAALIDRVRGA
ncbi:2-polyprenyl-6-methoxyphenol hydroxylase [Paraburkholderia dipogonis]|uniref:2-polyprenyl-6-methoxyphenol hydroxylase n=1 Tax=Paraburkholderia dipogonis TaxID=1211383 RepID=A0A4Y8MGJ7_9BURK|nr:FAD-dependent monooxygenase [Paraburkholderia dipogonis]TFE36514.1 2-polyprenyl-6-methoxyphenol hydroxylase [Paraburkholderia dipogonis]